MKLFQCNILGRQHLDKLEDNIINLSPDVICLQEADNKAIEILEKYGYQTIFILVTKRKYDGELVEEGVVLASKQIVSHHSCYYYKPKEGFREFDKGHFRDTTAHGYIIGDCLVDGQIYTVATTHFTWTPRGDIASEDQKSDLKQFMLLIEKEKPHVLCGDFNIPRHQNPLYEVLLTKYTDTIPARYKSSLDKTYHRLGQVASRAHLFTHFMVDYVFTAPPYKASNVKLIFGVSDHAGVVADISL